MFQELQTLSVKIGVITGFDSCDQIVNLSLRDQIHSPKDKPVYELAGRSGLRIITIAAKTYFDNYRSYWL